MLTAVGLIAAAAALARPAAPIPAAAVSAGKQASPGAAIATLMPDPGGVIAFGELHQTRATANVRSAISRFTDEILPVVAPHASHLIVETWITRGDCGEAEAHVTEEVARTTERPVETETEIMKLLRRAKELGVAPHVLDVPVPGERRTLPRSHQHLAGRLALTVHRGGRLLFRGESALAGLEHGV